MAEETSSFKNSNYDDASIYGCYALGYTLTWTKSPMTQETVKDGVGRVALALGMDDARRGQPMTSWDKLKPQIEALVPKQP